ncbi:MAG: CHAT domain-containing protein, partial [Planctomycetales bacterium]
RRTIQQSASVQSERQQLLMSQLHRWRLNGYISLASKAGIPDEKAYSYLLDWKGSIFIRQQQIRLRRNHPELAPLFNKLQEVSRDLASLTYADTRNQDTATRDQRIIALTDRKEQLEATIAHRVSSSPENKETIQLKPVDLKAVLPPGTALIDYFVFHESSSQYSTGNLKAFVVRPDRKVVQVDLGSMDKVETQIEAARAVLLKGGGNTSDTSHKNPLQQFHRLAWRPLETHLDGVTAVLVSPDGALASFPFAALPGKKPGTYLIEDMPVAVVSVPQLLPELLASDNDNEVNKQGPTLLAIGDVDFDNADSIRTPHDLPEPQNDNAPATTPNNISTAELALVRRAAPRGQDNLKFTPLPGTAKEVELIGTSFKEIFPASSSRILRQAEASEDMFRRLARHNQFIHIATHGFFAPAKIQSAFTGGGILNRQIGIGDAAKNITGWHPGLLSGLALAGANSVESNAVPEGKPIDDGILTALEVAEMDLRGTELVVLSACETGLGKVAGGEGVLGLQRALQIAGARTAVTSLWKVSDDATQVLMVEFYKNLWQKKLSKSESLRQAQLTILNRYDPKSGSLRERGLVLGDKKQTVSGTGTPAYYWAAFVLSGDWR